MLSTILVSEEKGSISCNVQLHALQQINTFLQLKAEKSRQYADASAGLVPRLSTGISHMHNVVSLNLYHCHMQWTLLVVWRTAVRVA